MYNHRLEKLKKNLSKDHLNGMIITNKENIFYLTEINYEGILCITETENIFFCEDIFKIQIENELSLEKEIMVKSLKKDLDFLKNIFKQDEGIVVEADDLTILKYEEFKQIFKTNLVPKKEYILNIRKIKEDSEIEKELQLGKILDNIFSSIKQNELIGKKERDLRNDIIVKLKKNMVENTENVRVSFGKNTINPYHKGNNTKIENNNILNIDITVKQDEYYVTKARTIFIGNVDEEIKEKYNKLLKVQDKMLVTLRPNKNIRELNEIYIKELEEINWQLEYYTAHGIGLSKKELPNFNSIKENYLEPKMVIVLEPQIYLKNAGLIVKDTIYLTEVNYRAITKLEEIK